MIKWISLASVYALAFSLIAATTPASHAAGEEDRPLGGRVYAESIGRTIHFPVLKTDITADIQGDLSTVTVVQTFANPTSVPLNATYLFPLNKDAAVHAMTMRVGDELVQAEIQRKEEAQATFTKAKREGKAAALLKQHRPNMFTQQIANLMPDVPITVTLTYAQTVPRIDGAYELVVPLIVGPRYQPHGADKPPQTAEAATPRTFAPGDDHPGLAAQSELNATQRGAGLWELQELPDYPDVVGLTIPDNIDHDRVSITVNLTSSLPIGLITSDTHALSVSGDQGARRITFAAGRTIDNRDFVLRYRLSGMAPQAGLLAHKDRRGGFFSLMIEPPEAPAPNDIVAREMVFVLDTSGSMSGAPMEASKTFMRHALGALRDKDYFRIVRFSNAAAEFSSQPVPATAANRQAGLQFVNGLSANGGTEVVPAIEQAFGVAQTPGTMRIVVFLSDGYIGNEASVLDRIAGSIGQARIYSFGVGTAVNRYLLAEMARVGRGFARFIDPTEKSHDAAIALAQRLETPVLTDIKINWGSAMPSEVTPAIIPDLFKGGSIRVQGRFANAGPHEIVIEGLANGRKARLPLRIDLPIADSDGESAAIPLIWARSQIADAMREMLTPMHLRQSGQDNKALKEVVTRLGLRYSLATKWTSFVAVSTKVVNADPAGAAIAAVPLPLVKGVSKHAYPAKRSAAARPSIILHSAPKMIRTSWPSFSGSSAPEPDVLGGLAVLALMGLLARRRRRRRGLG